MPGEDHGDVVAEQRRGAHEQLLVLVRALGGDAEDDAPAAQAVALADGRRGRRGDATAGLGAVVDDA